jgi:hypothetical protein
MDSTQPSSNYGWSSEATGTPTRRNIIPPQEESMQIFCKQMLKSRIFLGHYQERRHVDSISAYRDLIVLPESENDIIKDFEIVTKRVAQFYKSSIDWIGITGKHMIGTPAGGLCIWTETEGLSFGHYWFEVKTLKFRENEVMVRLKMIRSVETDTNTTTRQSSNSTFPEVSSSDFIELIKSWKSGFVAFCYESLATSVTRDNILAMLKFMCLLMVGLLHGSIEFVKFLGYFTIRFMHEFNRLIHVTTPLLLGALDILSKIVGGFYILIAMIWRDSKGPPKTQQYQRKAIRYNYNDEM